MICSVGMAIPAVYGSSRDRMARVLADAVANRRLQDLFQECWLAEARPVSVARNGDPKQWGFEYGSDKFPTATSSHDD